MFDGKRKQTRRNVTPRAALRAKNTPLTRVLLCLFLVV